MKVNNIVVEELGSKYKDSKYRDLFQIQVDYKNPDLTKLLHFDKRSIIELNTKVNELLNNTNTEIKKQDTNNTGEKTNTNDKRKKGVSNSRINKLQEKAQDSKKITRTKKRLN